MHRDTHTSLRSTSPRYSIYLLVHEHFFFFKVTLEPSSFTEEKFELYKKYQAKIHNDHRESPSGFKRFLVDSPLEVCILIFSPLPSRSNPYSKMSPIQYDSEPPSYLPKEYGSYHHLYRLDGKLIAMATLDILPSCVSSVYFMYDPELEKHSLGKVGT